MGNLGIEGILGKDKGEEMRQGDENGLAFPNITSKEDSGQRKPVVLTVIFAMLEPL